ncbi:FadR/GntR family transcriptional regulator [Actinophytocola sp. NPDC049390]|uniref:FadR/GntR family transcriptional regulator n=1 Tax=Actinophytocola sp. NPDC049390 TaxID=3363894 RepID=UPI0037B607E6
MTTPTVREALRRLEATGIVEFRHGSGTYVGTGISRVLEPAIAAAAARTRGAAALTRLKAAVTNAPHPPAGETRPAVHFHVALAAASGNRLLEESMEALLHVQILAAIRDGDPQAAETLTRTHLESIRTAIETAKFGTP